MDLSRIVMFANPNGLNEHSLEFIDAFDEKDQVEFTVLSLAEQLARYTNFPNPDRKKRIEDVLANAASEAAGALSDKISSKGMKCGDPEIVKGRFPSSLEAWFESNVPQLIVKQSLASDGEFGHVSKGDIRLSRNVKVPLLLLNTEFTKNSSIVVGIPPIFDDKSGLERALRIIDHSVFWAQKLDSTLHFVHAWELFGESYLRTHPTQKELNAELKTAKRNAEKEVETALAEAKIPEELSYSVHIHKGDPTRVLLAELELLKPTMVILGSVANEGVKGALLGNTAETVIRRKLSNSLIIK